MPGLFSLFTSIRFSMTTVKVNNFLAKFLMVRILGLIYCHQQAGLPSSNMSRLTSISDLFYYVAIKTSSSRKTCFPFKYLLTGMVILYIPCLAGLTELCGIKISRNRNVWMCRDIIVDIQKPCSTLWYSSRDFSL